MNQRTDRSSQCEPANAGDFFVVRIASRAWFVSREMVRHVERCLDTDPPAPWIVFVDIFGSRIRVAGGSVLYVEQCTAVQRERERAFHRLRDREDESDQPYES